MVTTFTYKPSLVRIDACNFELSQTHKQPQTHRQDWLQYTAPQLVRSVKKTPYIAMQQKNVALSSYTQKQMLNHFDITWSEYKIQYFHISICMLW